MGKVTSRLRTVGKQIKVNKRKVQGNPQMMENP